MPRKPKRYAIVNKDIIKWAKEYDGPPFHCLLTDAPYHLTTITKRFGKEGSVPAQHGRDGAFTRLGKGFMGQEWDGNMISFDPAMWHALGEHMHPGAFGMSFGGSRTAHRIAVAIEDAGFIIHPMIYWVYGSGFPKATRIDNQVSKKSNGRKGDRISELADAWKGHRYGMQALKPAAEPIIVFQKPYDGKPVDNIVSTGAGALNIDAGRIPLADGDGYVINTFDDGAKPFGGGAGHRYTTRKVREDKRLGGRGSWKTDKAAKNVYEGGYAGVDIESSPLGRWPANFILDDTIAPILNAHGDEGGASRYFYNVQTQLDAADPFLYVKKASTRERNMGLDNEPDIVYAASGGAQSKRAKGGTEYLQSHIGLNRINLRKNDHPTVKPIDLARYLASLLLPPDAYDNRRILVPFSGVASEMIGCLLAGWDYVEGVEMSKHYCELAEKRIRHWTR